MFPSLIGQINHGDDCMFPVLNGRTNHGDDCMFPFLNGQTNHGDDGCVQICCSICYITLSMVELNVGCCN